MDKNIISNLGHAISVNERKNIYITGVNKLESFDEEEFLMETTMGYLVVKGNDLELVKLDTKDGNVSIKGQIMGLTYMDQLGKQKKKGSFLDALFK